MAMLTEPIRRCSVKALSRPPYLSLRASQCDAFPVMLPDHICSADLAGSLIRANISFMQ